LRLIIKKRTTYRKKKVVLKGHFHVSTQELYNGVIKAEKATKKQARKKAKAKGKVDSYETKSKRDIKKKVKMNQRVRLKIVL
jgi:hypothetical protein